MSAAEASFFDGDYCQHVADLEEHARLERKHKESLEVLRLRTKAPLRAPADQRDAGHLPLFVAANEPPLFKAPKS